MKRALSIAMFFLAAAVFGQQQEDSPLVKAAKASGGPKKKSTKKVITNADVKKSKGKLQVLPPKTESVAATATAPADKRSSLEKQADDRRTVHSGQAATRRRSQRARGCAGRAAKTETIISVTSVPLW